MRSSVHRTAGRKVPRSQGQRWQHRSVDEDHLNVGQLVHDAYYYLGFTQLAKYAVFLVMGILVLLFHVSTMNNTPSTSYFRTSVTNQLATTFDRDNNDAPTWASVNSFYDAAVYYKSFLEQAINTSTAMQLPDGNVKIGEYGNVTYARIIVNFEENCRLSITTKQKSDGGTFDPNCLKDSNDTTAKTRFRTDVTFESNSTVKYNSWHTSDAKFYKFRAAAKTHTSWSALVVVRNTAELSREHFLDMLNTHLDDTAVGFISRYAYSVGLDIIAHNTISKGTDYAIFSLRAQRSASGRGVSIEAFKKLSMTTPGRRSLFSGAKYYRRIIAEVIFWITYIWMVALDFVQWRLASRQGCGIMAYFRTFWNFYNTAVDLLLAAWGVAYIVLIVGWHAFNKQHGWRETPNTCDDFFVYEFYPAYYTQWVYAGIALILLVGMRMLQFTRLHSGVNVFHSVFSKTVGHLMDFFPVFIFILCLFGTCVYMIFQVSGGNPNFLTWDGGASVLSRLAFSLSSYNDIYNDGIGAGRYGAVITAIFWLSIVFLLVWSGNIFLSAVSYAYESVREKNPQVEMFFLVEIFFRLIFILVWIAWMLVIYPFFHSKKRSHHLTTSILDPTLPNSPSVLPPLQPPSDLEAARTSLTFPPTSTSPTGVPLSKSPRISPPDSIELTDQSKHLLQSFSDRNSTPADALAPAGTHNNSINQSMTSEASAWSQAGQAPLGHGASHTLKQHQQPNRASWVMDAIKAPGVKGRGCWHRMKAGWHRADTEFYQFFWGYVEEKGEQGEMKPNPKRHPIWYMLARWAIASRPEMRAVATYFSDFRRFDLVNVQQLREQVKGQLRLQREKQRLLQLSQASTDGLQLAAETMQQQEQQDELELPVLRHIAAKDEDAKLKWVVKGVPELIRADDVQQLLEDVRKAHPGTLDGARVCGVSLVPMRLTKYLLGSFWHPHYVDPALMEALRQLYQPRFMKEIESTFAIDEDEEGAQPTLRDLQQRVQDPLAEIKADVAKFDNRLKRIEDLLVRLSVARQGEGAGREGGGLPSPADHSV